MYMYLALFNHDNGLNESTLGTENGLKNEKYDWLGLLPTVGICFIIVSC